MFFGYARVSTDKQELGRQIDALIAKGVPQENIFTEKMSGTITHRPELDRLLMCLRDGDILIIESLSRLGRSTKDLLFLLEKLKDKNISVVSLKESIDTSTPTGQLVTTILVAISQFERDVTVQRTREGLAAARARGRNGGRPPIDARKVNQAITLYQSQEYSIQEIVRLTGISRSTIYRALKDRQENADAD